MPASHIDKNKESPLPIKLGVSGCLNGEKIRFNGGSLKFAALAKLPEDDIALESFCPEVGIGLGVPRQPIRLVESDAGLRVGLAHKDDSDLSPALTAYAESLLEKASTWHGMVVAGGSPSCGMERVKRYSSSGDLLDKDGAGVFTATIRKYLPWLPVEEQGRLNDAEIRKNFLNRVYVCVRWRALIEEGLTAGNLLAFHQRHKMLLLAHCPASYKLLGKKLSNLRKESLDKIARDYFVDLMAALEKRATAGRHANVLQHMQGYVKQYIDADDKRELSERISLFQQGKSMIEAPLALLWHHLRRCPDDYMRQQYYFFPWIKGEIDAHRALPAFDRC